MGTFAPKKKGDFEKTIKDALLAGDVVRYDGRDEMPIEIMVRETIPFLSRMKNIGREEDAVFKKVYCSKEVLRGVLEELRTEFSVRKVLCQYSGCCQYATWAVYLDGE